MSMKPVSMAPSKALHKISERYLIHDRRRWEMFPRCFHNAV